MQQLLPVASKHSQAPVVLPCWAEGPAFASPKTQVGIGDSQSLTAAEVKKLIYFLKSNFVLTHCSLVDFSWLLLHLGYLSAASS